MLANETDQPQGAVKASESTRVCQVDGIPSDSHAECKVCNILVGSGHLEEAVDEESRCGTCSEGEFDVLEDPQTRVQRRRHEVLGLVKAGHVTREVCGRVGAPYTTVRSDIRWLQQMGLVDRTEIANETLPKAANE